MSLQKQHLANKMKRGSERKMDLNEFHILLNKAFNFLKVECPMNVAESMLADVDNDKDGIITYVEYFKVIDKFICRGIVSQPKIEAPKPNLK